MEGKFVAFQSWIKSFQSQ
uniref:Uncharacterized protein n=1 Tax=Anguilla anguilla TaxID=7936 RepID=A0A0E9SSX9_ANGAN